MNKVLKNIDYNRQTAVLSAFVLVGMVFLVPAITEKALGAIRATASGECGPEGQTHPCEFKLKDYTLVRTGAIWRQTPTEGVHPQWETSGESMGETDEKGNVVYNVEGLGTVEMYFFNPAFFGKNDCDQHKTHPVSGATLTITCTASVGHSALFRYTVRGIPP